MAWMARLAGIMGTIVWLAAAMGSTSAIQEKPITNGLQNPGFEHADGLTAWQLVVYGAKADAGLDATVKHRGERSFRVSAAEPSDVAFAPRSATYARAHGIDFAAGSRRMTLIHLARPRLGRFKSSIKQGAER